MFFLKWGARSQQAQRIKALRREWNELGPPSQAAERKLAERFNSQAQRAFDHCQPYFADIRLLGQTECPLRCAEYHRLSPGSASRRPMRKPGGWTMAKGYSPGRQAEGRSGLDVTRA